MTLTGSGMLLTLRHYIGFLSYAVDVLRYVALNVVNLRCLVVIHWSFQRIFWFVKCFEMLEATICSRTLHRTHVREIRR